MKYLLLILLFTGLFGCKNRILKKYCTNDTVEVIAHFTDTIRDTVLIEGKQIALSFDPVALAVDSVREIYSDSFAVVAALKQKNGQIQLQVKTRDRLIPFEKIVYRTVPVKVKANCEKCYLTQREFEARKKWIIACFIGLILLILLLLKK